jgi:dienelactone hydrolase
MLRQIINTATAFAFIACAASCNNNKSPEPTASTMEQSTSIKTENVDYTGDGVTMKGFVAYNDSLKGPLPVVLIVHEWWGLTDYPRMRAKQLAELGYLAFAVDMYGDDKTAETPDEAQKLSAPFYGSMKVATPRFEAALAKIKTFPNADTNRIAAIGYCFGGGMVLNMARTGEPLKGVVSFHGNLMGTPADKNLLKAEILVCHGDSDKFVLPAEVAAFKKQMDSVGAKYTFKHYANATHAFTNLGATEKGKKYNMPIEYNAAADTASFNEMKAFLARIFK